MDALKLTVTAHEDGSNDGVLVSGYASENNIAQVIYALIKIIESNNTENHELINKKLGDVGLMLLEQYA